MKAVYTFLFLVIAIITYSQEKLDYGKVKNDSNFNCIENSKLERYCFQIGNICDSKNELEIRLRITYFPKCNSELIVLACADGKWGAEKYKFTKQGGGVSIDEHAIYKIPKDDQAIFNMAFKKGFDTLKLNNIFLLPDQAELNIKPFVHDGVGFGLTFKAGDKFRSYHFNNPDSYESEYKNVPEFKNYIANLIKVGNI
jgi:hypothetical protein